MRYTPFPFRDPATKPDWADYTRLGGDRVAVLFEELRAAVGGIDGIIEDIHYLDAETGWVPRYRVGDTVLFVVHISPGQLAATMEVTNDQRERLLAAPLGAELKSIIRAAPSERGIAVVRTPLASSAAVRGFARAVKLKSRIAAFRASESVKR